MSDTYWSLDMPACSHRMMLLTALVLALMHVALGEKCVKLALEDCAIRHLLNGIVTRGHHVTLNLHRIPIDPNTFCRVNVVDFQACLVKNNCKDVIQFLTNALSYLCGDGRSGWEKYMQCLGLTSPDMEYSLARCEADFLRTGAWITMEPYKFDSDEVVGQCTFMKEYVKCAEKALTAVCDGEAAKWYVYYIKLLWRPFKDIVLCDVYGPTGGVPGLVAGIVVAVILVISCMIAIWYHKSPRPVMIINTRKITSL